MIAAEAATALYAYAVVGPAGPAVARALPPELELIGDDDVAIVVERVSLDEFAEDALRENLNDREWLEAKARRHEAVVQMLLGGPAVVPLRFGSIHHDADAVRTFLDERRTDFGGALRRVHGRLEMGVKAWLVQGGAATEDAAPSSGRAYLEARRRARDDAAHAAERRAELLLRAHERLLHVSEAGVLNRPQPPELSGRDEVMVMNAAYLVRAGDERLAAEVQQLNAGTGGIAFELTGPWAPYNFVETGA